MKYKIAFSLCAVSCAIVVIGCGVGGGNEPDPDDKETYEISFPLADSVSWTYECSETSPDCTYTLTKFIDGTRVFPHDTVGYIDPWYVEGLYWYRQIDQDSTFYLNDGDYIWMGLIESSIAGFGADPFVPFRAIPLEYSMNDTFSTLVHKSVLIMEADINFSLLVSDHEDVTTPAGTFQDCLKLEMQLTNTFFNDTTLATFWVKDGIGLIKRHDYYESGSDHTYYEELSGYDID